MYGWMDGWIGGSFQHLGGLKGNPFVVAINKNPNAPMETFKYSIIYLMALFVIMLIDHYVFPVSTL